VAAAPAAVAPEAPSAALALRCRGLTKEYVNGSTRTIALRGVDLDVRPGEVLMLVGPSGCGKTTLISVMAGILDRTEGECLVFGQDIEGLPPAQRTAFRGRNVGFVFQAFNLLPSLTAAENVAVPLLLAGVRWREAVARGVEMLSRVGMRELAGRPPTQLSGGEQQRVAIARALVHDPRLVVCDEPTSSLDHETGRHVMETLRAVAAGPDRALVVVTHDARIFEFGDRMAVMDDGRIVRIETPSRPQAPRSPA
jgi:putative ABC transport system ATP-binding protein